MPAAYRIVTRIQDQDDFSGVPSNAETIFWNAAGGYFEPVSAAQARTNLGLGTLATQNGSFTGGGTVATGGFTLTVPATGTAALLGVANVFTQPQRFPDGAAGAPGWSFAGATWMGMFRNGNDVGWSHNGFSWMYYSYSSPLKLSAVIGFGWSNVTDANGTPDVIMGRDGSGYFNILKSSALTNAVAPFTLRHNSSGTPAAGYGLTLAVQGKSSTTNDQDMLGIETTWATATHASRKARTVFNVYDTAAREVMRGEASGSAPMIGFLGAAAVARAAHIADPSGGGTQDAEARTAINAILVVLENIGFIATS